MDKQNYSLNSEQVKTESYQRHQKQRFWQILVPVIVGGVLVLAAAVFMALSLGGVRTGVSVSQWADTAAIWIILPVVFAAVVLSLVLFVLIYGVAKVLHILPNYTFLVQFYVKHYADRIQQASRKSLTPIITQKSIFAGVQAFFSSLFGRISK